MLKNIILFVFPYGSSMTRDALFLLFMFFYVADLMIMMVLGDQGLEDDVPALDMKVVILCYVAVLCLCVYR